LYDGTRSSQPNGQIIDSKRCSSACSGTCDWMNSVAELGLTPAASQSTAMLMTFCEISPELS